MEQAEWQLHSGLIQILLDSSVYVLEIGVIMSFGIPEPEL